MKHQVSVFVEEAAEQLQVCCFSDLRSLSGRNCFSLPKHRQFMDSHWQRAGAGGKWHLLVRGREVSEGHTLSATDTQCPIPHMHAWLRRRRHVELAHGSRRLLH